MYVKLHNEAPKPCVGVKTADQILASIQRFCLRTSETGHYQEVALGVTPASGQRVH